MPALMGNPFTLAFWRSEGLLLAPEEAVGQLQTNYLSANSTVQFVDDADIPTLLDGDDPLLNPSVDMAAALFSTGWGQDGQGEAILFIARATTGNYYWHGILYDFDGFVDPPAQTPPPGTATPLPTSFTVLPTETEYVLALETVNVRSGPNTTYAAVSFLSAGQTAPVFGISEDGNWWYVLCPDHTVGCWMTANPSYTQPTTDPDDNADGEVPINETGEAIVEELTVRMLESFPVQVQAVVRGQLPDACAYIERVEVVRESMTFRIRMTTARRPNQRCAPMPTPFEEIVSLDVAGLPAGEYDVRINDLVEPFTLAVANETEATSNK